MDVVTFSLVAELVAVTMTPGNGVPAGTVLQVLEPGYMIHERVLRPARVVVSAAPA